MTQNKYGSISAKPVKGFFVEMLTRDLSIEDAILDLLDNCVDGILRNQPKEPSDIETPYIGFWAKITINETRFEIEDNCGGIPWEEHDRAFRLGRPADTNQSNTNLSVGVGVYGIGMKRAIFKMGNEALIWTQNGDDSYEVPISQSWMNAEDSWELEVKNEKGRRGEDGTFIIVESLRPEIQERFAAESFKDDLLDKIASHYAVILRKGFRVEVNGTQARPKPIVFRFARESNDKDEVRPYMFKSTFDDVQVFLAVGLREPIPGIERTLEEQEGVKFSSDYAGWTIICNDRVVAYCNRDELTGWGTAGVPQYHTQFISISGVVEFTGNPKKLPTTTTKRGLSSSSSLYQQVLDRMREGLRLFVDFTNKWKTRESEVKAIVSPVPSIPYSSLKSEVESIPFNETRTGLRGEQYKPKLPMPPSNSTDLRISYLRAKKETVILAERLLPDFEDIRDKDIPRRVGEASFDFAYEKLIGSK